MKDIGAMLLIVGLVVALPFVGLAAYRYFTPRFIEAETDAYRESRSYVEATVRDLRKLKREYEMSSKEHKSSLRTIILQRSDEIDHKKLPGDVREFLSTL